MTQSSDFFNIAVAADGAGISNRTLLGASGIHSHRSVVVTQGFALGSATDSASLGGVAVSIHPGVTQSGNLIGNHSKAADAAGGGITALGAGRIGDHNTGGVTGVPAIMVSTVLKDRTGLSPGSLQIGTVAVFQPGRCNAGHILGSGRAFPGQTVDKFLNAGATVHIDLTGLLGGDDGSATADGYQLIIGSDGGIQETVADDRAVDIDDNILQITGGSLIAAGGGRIGSNLQLIAAEYKAAPVLVVVDIDIVAARAVKGQIGGLTLVDLQGSALGNIDLHTGCKDHILLQGGSAGIGVDGDVAVQAQDIVGGIELGSANHQVQNGLKAGVGHINDDALNGGITINIHDQTVGRRIVILGHGAVLRTEHTIGTDEFYGRRIDVGAGNGHGSKDILSSTGMNGQGHFDILHIVLRCEEALQIVIGGIAIAILVLALAGIHESGQIGAAQEVGDLHGLVDLSPGEGINGAVTIDITPNIHRTAIVDSNAGIGTHVDSTVRTAGATTIGTGLGSALQGGQLRFALDDTINSEVCAIGKGQSTISRGGGVGGGDGGIGAHSRIGIISGQQQSHTSGQGIIACGDGAVHGQRDLLVTAGGGIINGFLEAGDVGASHIEHRGGVGNDDGLQGIGGVILGSKSAVHGNILTKGSIVPAHKLIAGAGIGSEGISHSGGVFDGLGVGACGHGGRGGAVGHGIATGGGSLEGGGDGRNTGLDQAQVGDGNADGISTVARFAPVSRQYDRNTASGGQLLGIAAGGGSIILGAVHSGGATNGEVTGNGKVEGQGGSNTLIVGNGQGVAGSQISHYHFTAGNRTVNGVTAGLPVRGAAV